MGVAGHHQLVAVGGEAVQHPRFGRMSQAEPQVRRRACRARDRVVAVPIDVRVVDARGGDVQTGHLELAAGVGEVEPAALGERRPQILPGQRLAADPVTGVAQVIQRVLQARPEVVVAAEDEDARPRQQIAQGLDNRGHRLGVRQVVAGVDDQVGLPAGQLAQPGLFAALVGQHVEVADVQHSQRWGARRQDGHGQLAQHERVALDDRGITDPGDSRAERNGTGAYQGGQYVSHAGSLLPVADSRRISGVDETRWRADRGPYGGGGGGGGASSGMVIGGRPGISTTCDPTGGGIGGPPSGGGGGAGGMPLLTWIVMIDPGIVCPFGVVPTTSPSFALLLTEVGLVGNLETRFLQALNAPRPPRARRRWAPVKPGEPST